MVRSLGRDEDSTHIKPMLEGTKEKLEAIGWKKPLRDGQISADTGYYSARTTKSMPMFLILSSGSVIFALKMQADTADQL